MPHFCWQARDSCCGLAAGLAWSSLNLTIISGQYQHNPELRYFHSFWIRVNGLNVINRFVEKFNDVFTIYKVNLFLQNKFYLSCPLARQGE